MLGLHEDACVGCGLCQVACPQRAVSVPFNPPVLENEALLVCEKSLVGLEQQCVSCVHQVSLDQLADLYESGVRTLRVGCGDCETCHAPERKLEDAVSQLNVLVTSRGLQPFDIVAINSNTKSKWTNALPHTGLVDPGKRALFRSLGASFGEGGAQRTKEHSTPGLAKLQQENSQKPGAVFLAVPHIEEEQCEGCDMCVRICPNVALTKIKDAERHACYAIAAQNCNHCGLCETVCSAGALKVTSMSNQEVRTVRLQTHMCSACGVPFHVAGESKQGRTLCNICSKTNHTKKLFQVLS